MTPARSTPTPRRVRALCAGAALTLVTAVAACAGSPPPAGPAPAAPEASAYPVSIAHKYGTTQVTAEPKRVVLVGLNEQDAMLALGVVPVATSKFLEAPGGIHPWARAALGTAPEPVRLDQTDGIPFEQVAQLRPDLIVGLYSGLTQQDYDTLTKIAPTVAQPAGQEDYNISWQDTTLTLGRILGRQEQARKIVDATEALFAAQRAAHPEFVGRTAVMATLSDGYYFFGAKDPRGQLLTSLGFTVPAQLGGLVDSEGFGGNIPGEKVDLLDVQALIWLATADTEDTLRRDALYRTLNVVKQGREVLVKEGEPVNDAISFVTPLSIPLVLDTLVPRLSAAVDGDPGTAVPTS